MGKPTILKKNRWYSVKLPLGMAAQVKIFKLSEQEIRDRLEDIEDFTDGAMRFRESANLKQIQKQRDIEKNLLRAIYQEGS